MTHNRITQDAARKVMSKIDQMGEIALFRVGHASWEATRTSTKSYLDKLRLRPENFLGVFDINAKIEDIMDDLFDIGVK
jgi:hypothetical protein